MGRARLPKLEEQDIALAAFLAGRVSRSAACPRAARHAVGDVPFSVSKPSVRPNADSVAKQHAPYADTAACEEEKGRRDKAYAEGVGGVGDGAYPTPTADQRV